ncbi:MAG TPA: DMT family transporter [Burkholderiales bacterium]|nr:DMT family transporter [Burkholderiales bacterium]
MASRSLPFAVLGAGVVIVSFAAILIRFAHAEGVASLAIASVRLSVAALILAPFAWLRAGREMLALQRRELLLCLLSGTLLAIHFWAWITSLEHTSVASSTALVTTNPLWVALASALFLRERPGRSAWIGVVLTLAGSAMIFVADAGRSSLPGNSTMLGNALALMGAAAASGYLLAGRALRARVSLTAYLWLAYASAAVILVVAALSTGITFGSVPESAWIFMIALGIGPQLLGHTSFNWALRRLSATFVAVAILGEPVGAAILAWFFFGEGFSAPQFAGFALLLAGIFLAARDEVRSGKPSPGPGK